MGRYARDPIDIWKLNVFIGWWWWWSQFCCVIFGGFGAYVWLNRENSR
jgi:hypothetical protein